MNPELHELVESVRALGIELTGKPAPASVRMSDTTNLAERLERVRRALDSFDASSAAGNAAGTPRPSDDPSKLKEALDRLVRLHQVRGGALDEVDAIIRETFGLGEPVQKKRKKEYSTLPAFAPSRLKRKKGYRPRLNLMPDRPGEATLSDIRKIVYEAEMSTAILGATVPGASRAFEKTVRRPVPPPARPGR